ncbi:MAG: methyltransferase, partial [Methanomassiliicoccales archaeon]|nr:methyltransferase [Methanomassiliicoccales archaeon]
MFSGIGPFAIMIAKQSQPKIVYAIDINPEAIELMKENIALNKATVVQPILGDAGEVVPKLEKVDRIVMNLPHSALNYIHEALIALKPEGVVHYYEIMDEVQVQQRLDQIADSARREGRIMKELARRKVKSYSPSQVFYAFDLQFL